MLFTIKALYRQVLDPFLEGLGLLNNLGLKITKKKVLKNFNGLKKQNKIHGPLVQPRTAYSRKYGNHQLTLFYKT